MNIDGSSKDFEHEMTVTETLRKNTSRDGVYNFCDLIGAHTKKHAIGSKTAT